MEGKTTHINQQGLRNGSFEIPSTEQQNNKEPGAGLPEFMWTQCAQVTYGSNCEQRSVKRAEQAG